MTNLGGGATHVLDTTPYAWPFDGNLAGPATAVLVVYPRGPVGPAVGADSNAAEVVTAIRAAGGAVVHVSTAPPRSEHATCDAPPVPVTTADAAIAATGIDGFYGSGLDAHLRVLGATRLILVGRGTETCLHSTMRSANDRGYECLLVADACTPYDPTLTAAAVSMIEMSGGIFGAVGTARAVVAAYTPRST